MSRIKEGWPCSTLQVRLHLEHWRQVWVTASDRDCDQPEKERAATKMGEGLKSDHIPALNPAERGPFKTTELLATLRPHFLPFSPDCTSASPTPCYSSHTTRLSSQGLCSLPSPPPFTGLIPSGQSGLCQIHLLIRAPLPPNLKKLSPSPVLELALPSGLLLLPATILCIHLFNRVSCLPQ